MSEEQRGLGIILHSGAYDRLSHGLSIALAASALGRKVQLFFTYEATEHLKRGGAPPFHLTSPDSDFAKSFQKNLEQGRMETIPDLLAQAKALGAKFYACSNSMGLLNITRDELIEAVDRSMGLTTFLTQTSDDQILFI
jgi:peroxiredoxin family protein